jgi:hypothetical protein
MTDSNQNASISSAEVADSSGIFRTVRMLLIIAILLCVATYAYCVSTAITLVAGWTIAESSISAISSSLGDLEGQLVLQKDMITENMARERGFGDVQVEKFVHNNSGKTLSFNQ